MNTRIAELLTEDALRAARCRDRNRIVFVERNGETFVGYTPRQLRGPTASRAERNRMERFARYVWFTRRLPFRVCCIRPGEGSGWMPATPTYLPMRGWRLGPAAP